VTRIHRLHLAELRNLPDFHPEAGNDCSVYAFLIESDRGPVLVDTGIGTGSRLIERLYHPEVRPLADALGERGLEPGDVRCVVNTHLHFDHCGQNRVLAGTPVYVQRAEREAARATPGYTVPEWFDHPGADLRLLDGDHELAPGLHVISTPGHTPGHQSVLVEHEGVRSLICGQAAYTRAEYRAGGDPSQAHPGLGETYTASLERIAALEADEVLFSHDRAPDEGN